MNLYPTFETDPNLKNRIKSIKIKSLFLLCTGLSYLLFFKNSVISEGSALFL